MLAKMAKNKSKLNSTEAETQRSAHAACAAHREEASMAE